MSTESLLIELQTEELPPGQAPKLGTYFANALAALLNKHQIPFGAIQPYTSPRHLAVLVSACGDAQPGQTLCLKGPSLAVAKKEDGSFSPAALGFAKKCGTTPENLITIDGKLAFEQQHPPTPLPQILEKHLPEIIDGMPIAKRMRWGAHEASFVRPIHGLVVLYGEQCLDNVSVYHLSASRQTCGHRFLHPQPVTLHTADDYISALKAAFVLVDPEERKSNIMAQLVAEADKLSLDCPIDALLLEEVNYLVEWPVVYHANFEASFLKLPKEVPIMAMKVHQRYFPLFDKSGELSNQFLLIANLPSNAPEAIVEGNARVVRARLQDALFFYESDQKTPLSALTAKLDNVVFQKKLGSIGDKVERLVQLSAEIARRIKADVSATQQAARLCKADLLTLMVGEFPELQGKMGHIYALMHGEDEKVAQAIEAHYQPRFAKDALPASREGQALALADKIDTLVGIFGIGLKPTGNRDPFALRRSILGVLRILVENQYSVDFAELLQFAATLYKVPLSNNTASELLAFSCQRFEAWFSEMNVNPALVNAVLSLGANEPVDIFSRIEALQDFIRHPDATALAAAHKRVGNLLSKVPDLSDLPTHCDSSLLEEAAEKILFEQIEAVSAQTAPLLSQGNYAEALAYMSTLRPFVDAFFEEVMVMCDDKALQKNRLALLQSLRKLFLQIADIAMVSL